MKIIKKIKLSNNKVDAQICNCIGDTKCLPSERHHIILNESKDKKNIKDIKVIKKNDGIIKFD
jgi:hypothetical protein